MPNSGEESFKDERVLALAGEVSKAVPTLVPRLLVQLQGKISSCEIALTMHLQGPLSCVASKTVGSVPS